MGFHRQVCFSSHASVEAPKVKKVYRIHSSVCVHWRTHHLPEPGRTGNSLLEPGHIAVEEPGGGKVIKITLLFQYQVKFIWTYYYVLVARWKPGLDRSPGCNSLWALVLTPLGIVVVEPEISTLLCFLATFFETIDH